MQTIPSPTVSLDAIHQLLADPAEPRNRLLKIHNRNLVLNRHNIPVKADSTQLNVPETTISPYTNALLHFFQYIKVDGLCECDKLETIVHQCTVDNSRRAMAKFFRVHSWVRGKYHYFGDIRNTE